MSWGPPSPEPPRHPALEAAVARDPHDLGALAIYADFLTERGDPRGAVLSAWLQHTRTPAPTLSDRIDAWCRAHHDALLGPLAGPARRVGLDWRGPLLDLWASARPTEHDLRTLLDHPATRALRAVSLNLGARDPRPTLDTLGAGPRPRALRWLSLAWTWMPPADLDTCWTAFDTLDALRLDGPVRLGRVHLPTLTALELDAVDGLPTEVSGPHLKHLAIRQPPDAALLAAFFAGAPHVTSVDAALDAPSIRALPRGLHALTVQPGSIALDTLTPERLPRLRRIRVLGGVDPTPLRHRFGDRVEAMLVE